jgi:hypothetical protein
VAGFCEYGDEPSGSGATELVDTVLPVSNFALCSGRHWLKSQLGDCSKQMEAFGGRGGIAPTHSRPRH